MLAVVEDTETRPTEVVLTQTLSFKHIDRFTHEAIDMTTPKDSALRTNVFYALNNAMGSRASGFGHVYPMRVLSTNLDAIETYLRDNDISITEGDFAAFLAIVAKARDAVTKDIEDRIARGTVEFDDLPFLFTKGKRVFFGTDDLIVAGPVVKTTIRYGWSGPIAEIQIEILHNMNGKIELGRVTGAIGGFSGLRNTDTLPVKMLDKHPDVEAMLVERGRKFMRYAEGVRYCAYQGNIVQRSWWGEQTFRADGRVMVDVNTMRRVANDVYSSLQRQARIESKSNDEDKSEAKIAFTEDRLYATSPVVFGFSFRAKQWGEFAVARLSDIAWREDAFDKLVLPEGEKKMVRALVEHSGDSFTDIVEGKGGGCIFMLYGPPGQGKTLTAETVAELLHRPLYSVSVGELGTEPDQLESRLREILDVAQIWNAVLLLDEADIFLEARDERDILRNAMVGVFLRLLEYHQGVLFLTTNRVRNIDQAFYSRISIALNFPTATNEKRRAIWVNLLDAASIVLPEKDVADLAEYDLNGRQIKNIIRISQTLAKAEGVSTLSMDHLEHTVRLTTAFEKQMRPT